MRIAARVVLIVNALVVASAVGQTTVTTSGGTVSAVPLFSGTSTLSNSNIYQVNGNVGIGVTSPISSLQIGSGQLVVPDNSGSSAPSIVANPSSGVGIGFNTSVGTIDFLTQNQVAARIYSGGIQAGIFHPLGQTFVFSGADWNFALFLNVDSNGVTHFNSIQGATIPHDISLEDYGGNVGIGTATPGAKLDVAGSLKISQSGAGLIFPDGTTQSTAYLPSSSGANITSVGTLTSGTWNATPIAAAYLPPNVDYIDAAQTFTGQKNFTSNVGIGAASPRSALEIDSLDANYPSTATSSLRVGGINPGPASTPLNGVSSVYQILFSSYRDIQQDTVGAKIAAVNNAVFSSGGTGNYWRVQNTDIAFSTLSTVPTSADGTSEKMRLTAAGNLGIGTPTPGADLVGLATPPQSSTPIVEVNGDIAFSQGSGGQMYFQDGTVQSTAWNGTTLGGDYAESVDVLGARAQYEPGDVIAIANSTTGKFEKSGKAYSKMVAGVFSTKPGLVGRRTTAARPDKNAEVPMAMMGIVPTKVTTENGPIERGDLLVSSSTPGYAMKGTDPGHLAGAIIGKALEPLPSGTGMIEVLLALQ